MVERPETVAVSGSVNSPDAPSDVPFLVSGRVIRVAVHEGDQVRRGQLLAALDKTDYMLAMNGTDAQVAAAKVAQDRAEDEYKRMKMLYESKSLPTNDFHKFEAAYNGAKEQLNQAAASAKETRKRLGDTNLLAPVDGFISRRGVEPGNMATAGVPVFQIVTLDPIEIVVGVPETGIHLVRVGQSVQVRIPALPGELLTGTIREINVASDPSTRTYTTRVRMANPQHKLRVGMIAEAEILADKKVKAMTVPASAIIRDPQGASLVFVFYPEQKRVCSKHVETGRVVGEEVEILSGLRADEQVVIGGQQELRDGIAAESVASRPEHIAVNGAEGK
jgi:RND family efflux transporter MFP subunit